MPALLFAALLVTAQVSSALHAFEHNVGTPQSKVCATCIGASQLDAASVDSPQSVSLPASFTDHASSQTVTIFETDSRVVRQRGPPTVI